MIAAILAGGYGKRLKPLTDDVPKPLVGIKENYTILDKQIMDYIHAGVNEIYLLVGYKWEKIKERYGEEWKGVKLHYLVEDKPMGTLYALRNLFRQVDEDVFVSNGDIVADFNLREMKKQAMENPQALILIAVTNMRSPFGIVELKNGRITSFREKPILPYYINAGFYYIKKEARSYFFKEYESRALENSVFPLLANLKRAYAYVEEDAFWHSVDSLKDLERVRKEYEYREDRPWGYEKRLHDGVELLIKKGYGEAMLHLPHPAEVRAIRGKCEIESNILIELDEGKHAFLDKGEYRIRALSSIALLFYQSK